VEIGSYYLRIAAFLEFSYVILFVNTSILQGLKKPAFALWIGLYRQLVMPIILFCFTTKMLNLGLNGIWWSIFVINWSAGLVAAYYARKKVAALEREAKP
jgi:Na+-driven multidrug efflux pump